ncbi:gas vesicle protein [uncultured Thiodictyon sp.]|uniref:gas vesicle protein n=1 Tax=uncultured Thiodictyon sp. TaxID=1846217 RepID=UPI0025E08670|nr:gas vesicle protein [uncultured Thiodictyon sp.]
MSVQRATLTHSTNSTSVADLLERVLDKGIVIAGDIRIKLVDIELLTIQLRLVICSVDKAKEMGIDWWSDNAMFKGLTNKDATSALPAPAATPALAPTSQTAALEDRLARLESLLLKQTAAAEESASL